MYQPARSTALLPVGVHGDGLSQALNSSSDELAEPTSWELRMRWHIYSRLHFLVESSWVRPNTFLVWKVFVVLWSTAVWLATLSKQKPTPFKFFVFLTHWNQTGLLFYLLCSLYLCVRYWHGRRGLSSFHEGSTVASSYRPSPFMLRMTFYMCEHAFVWTCLVVLMYWSTEFPHWLSQEDHSSEELFWNICIHGVTGLIIWTDVWLGRVEFVFSHLLINLPLACLYVLTNCIYVQAGGAPLYQIMQWKNAMTAVAVLGCLLLIALGLWPLGRAYTNLRNRCSANQPPLPPQETRWFTCAASI